MLEEFAAYDEMKKLNDAQVQNQQFSHFPKSLLQMGTEGRFGSMEREGYVKVRKVRQSSKFID